MLFEKMVLQVLLIYIIRSLQFIEFRNSIHLKNYQDLS
jgi:hypothetical protein